MVIDSGCVLDEVLHGSTAYYTADKFNEAMGLRNKLTISAVADNVDADGTLTVQIEHSADRRNWHSKNATAEINNLPLYRASTSSAAGSDSGATVLLPFVRLRVRLQTTTQAHVKLHFCGRDG